ncbi:MULTISPECIES: hypothetical protein [Geobacter]|uniref:hypothetical protein n=1 Tax=Geobacter TaxID=28231 RepID=UPI0001D8F24C|nr:hypothetical protein [Geobacter sulfurreducens]ADI82994.1 hypothetical protein KN400_0131 [Geobacter sulfurreducens KN400]AJY69891.1 hypothetical protein RW64_09990 [Geobacter sulfurreducens]BET59997.1 hypothetical protein GEO60473_30370 [Geobacter sp. 60473]
MVQIIDKKVNLEYPLGHHLHCMIAQVPNHLRGAEKGFAIEEPDRQWERVRSILDLVAAGEGNLKKLHFLMFPETHVPVGRFDEMLTAISGTFRPNTVTMFGVEHVSLKAYREMLERFREDNAEAIELVDRDIDSGDVLEMPVNWCCIAVKEATGKLRVFLEAKSHPFHGEEFLDKFHDLYRGRHFYLFRSRPSCFNFMVLICLDYLYRDLYSSNIKQIIDHANQLYFSTRQTLDTIFVVQCNPKPEHRAYRDVLAGFYGEYLEDTPGVRETVTVFGNTSEETRIEDVPGGHAFGTSSVVINSSHRLARVQLSEFATDDFDGAPICRLRFGTGTRLYYFNLPLHHEIDPRTTRVPLKVHTIMRPSRDGGWVKISGDELVAGFEIAQDA